MQPKMLGDRNGMSLAPDHSHGHGHSHGHRGNAHGHNDGHNHNTATAQPLRQFYLKTL